MEKAAATGLVANRHEDTDEHSQEDVNRIVTEGESAKAAALEYADWLVCTMNDTIPDDDQDYQNIVNTVQRHTRCSAAYCLWKKDIGF